MCYVVYLSTTSPEDLSARKVEGFVFDRDVHEDLASKKLLFPNRWRAGDPGGGCSCHFRHLMDATFGFGGPEDWMPEDPEDLASTLEFAVSVRDLRRRGFEVDCVSRWWSDAAEIRTRTVSLDGVRDEEFRFFENWHFVFEGGREAP